MEERIKILEMLQQGVITVEEANELLKTIDNQKVEVTDGNIAKSVKMSDVVKNSQSRFLHINITSSDGDKVNVNIPVSFLKAAIASGTISSLLKKSIKINGINDDIINNSIDIDMIIDCVNNDFVGELVDINSADGDIVKIYFE